MTINIIPHYSSNIDTIRASVVCTSMNNNPLIRQLREIASKSLKEQTAHAQSLFIQGLGPSTSFLPSIMSVYSNLEKRRTIYERTNLLVSDHSGTPFPTSSDYTRHFVAKYLLTCLESMGKGDLEPLGGLQEHIWMSQRLAPKLHAVNSEINALQVK